MLNENKPLIKSIIRRYTGKGVEYEDLMQIASVGFLKAVANFKDEFSVRFSTYAVPMILGEVKRFMRDDGYIKVSRSTKALSAKIYRYIEEGQKEGTIIECDPKELVIAFASMLSGLAYTSIKNQDKKIMLPSDKTVLNLFLAK